MSVTNQCCEQSLSADASKVGKPHTVDLSVDILHHNAYLAGSGVLSSGLLNLASYILSYVRVRTILVLHNHISVSTKQDDPTAIVKDIIIEPHSQAIKADYLQLHETSPSARCSPGQYLPFLPD